MTRAVIYARYSSDNQRDASTRTRSGNAGPGSTRRVAKEARSTLTTPSAAPPPCDPDTSRSSRTPGRALRGPCRRGPRSPLARPGEYSGPIQTAFVRRCEIDHLIGRRSRRTARRAQGDYQCPVPEGPRSQNAARPGRPRSSGQIGAASASDIDVVRKLTLPAKPVHGERRINKREAAIVRRIFEGVRKRPLAKSDRPIPEQGRHPRSRAAGAGDLPRSMAIGGVARDLNNELYIGRLVWNRQQFIKIHIPGRRRARLNPETKWIVEDVPHLRIIDDPLWTRVKERQQASRSRVMTKDKGIRSERTRRPSYLLSGLLKCGTCGGGFSKISQSHYGCSTARNKGTCDNLLTVRRDELEAKVLDGLRHQLMHPELVTTFIDEFHREVTGRGPNKIGTATEPHAT